MNTKISTLTSALTTPRNQYIDVLKGMAIICVVLAHCGFQLSQEIYLFHMAVFFMSSGYFYNNAKSDTLGSVGKYIFKKALSLYVPYVIFNALLILFHNQLIDLNLLTDNQKFLEIGGLGAKWGLQFPYDHALKKAGILSVLQFQNEPQLAGATWFLRALFAVSVFHCLFMYVVNMLRKPWLQTIAITIAVVGCCFIAMFVQNNQFVIIAYHRPYFAAWLAYLMGICIRKYEHFLRYDFTSALMAAIALLLLKHHGAIDLGNGFIQNIPFFIVCSLSGWILLRSTAEFLPELISKALAYSGKHSMSIVLLHFLSFKAVTLIVILLTGQDMVLLASFPRLESNIPHIWAVYTAAGVGIPLALNAAYQPVKRIVKKRLSDIYKGIYNRCRRSSKQRCDQ